jgi:hypothetical protein
MFRTLNIFSIALILVACPVSDFLEDAWAAETVSAIESTDSCEKKGNLRMSERSIEAGVESALTAIEGHFNDSAKEDERKLAGEYVTRTRTLFDMPVDHLHGRCWNEDQVSCAMLLSSVHEISFFLRSLNRSNPASELVRLVTKVDTAAIAVDEFCKHQPWRLS